MTTSDESWSGRLRQIGELERRDHWHLVESDVCYFFGEYTPYKGYSHSKTNQIISNLKKPLSVKATSQWPHKLAAIEGIGRLIGRNLKPEALPGVTFVPIPPSKPPGSPAYDDRMVQVARNIAPNCDVRELLVTSGERDARHTSGGKRDPAELKATLSLRSDLLAKPPNVIALLDDVLTTGCSFKVCREILQDALPEATIIGIFAARRVVDRTSAWEDFADVEF